MFTASQRIRNGTTFLTRDRQMRHRLSGGRPSRKSAVRVLVILAPAGRKAELAEAMTLGPWRGLIGYNHDDESAQCVGAGSRSGRRAEVLNRSYGVWISNSALTCGFVGLVRVCSVDGGSGWGSGQGGRDGCVEELEDAALDGGGFGQGHDDGTVGAVSDVVAGQCPEVGEQALVDIPCRSVSSGGDVVVLPGGDFVVVRAGLEAAVQDADESVRELA